jgi:hypothetical protein
MSDSPGKSLPFRWLTVGEIVGVAALVIAGLGYWDAHRDRVAQARAHQAEIEAVALKHSFLMTGTPNGAGDRVRLASVNSDQVIQTQTVWFPTAIRAGSVETTGDPRLDAGWVEAGLRRTAGKSKAGRLPVGVLTIFIEDGQTRTDRAVYQLGYSLHPRFLRGDRVELEGLSLARRGVAGDLQAVVDRLWSAR